MKNTFVHIDEKQAEFREKIVRSYVRTSDDTHGQVCMNLLNDTPGYVVSKKGKSAVIKG